MNEFEMELVTMKIDIRQLFRKEVPVKISMIDISDIDPEIEKRLVALLDNIAKILVNTMLKDLENIK